MGPQDVPVAVQPGPDWSRMRVCGELDLASAGRVIDAILGATQPGRRLEVDLRQVASIDSSGMAGLERWDGGAVSRLLGPTGMNRVLQVSAGPA